MNTMNVKIHNDNENEGPAVGALARGLSKRQQGNGLVEESREIQRMEHLAFENIQSIEFCIDGAVGLPFSTTASRVTARLLDHNREQIGEPSSSTVSQPDSQVSSPKFDLQAGWRGSALIPTITVVCRIDTLEAPNLQPRCIGFSVLKLYVDSRGSQPDPFNCDGPTFLNAGQYLLPIVYGSVPPNGVFSESLMDRLPHIYDAYLSVRLYDPNIESSVTTLDDEFGGDRPGALSTGRDTRRYDLSNSVLACMLRSVPGAGYGLPRIPVEDNLVQEIVAGIEVSSEDKKVASRACMEWLMRLFPPVHKKLPGVNQKYLLKYSHRIGTFVALDMLYNMPERPKLIPSAEEAVKNLKSNSIFSKAYDDKLTCFKTYFRYLPGSLVPKKLKGDATDFVIDDASLELDFSSKELNPVYNDDFSRTTGFDLSPHACLLVVVTAVDVLTNRRADSLNPTNYFQQKMQDHPHHNQQDGGGGNAFGKPYTSRPTSRAQVLSFGFDTAEDEKSESRTLQERAFKLRGLVGIHYGYEDPTATWWGIVPLLAKNPPPPAGAGKKYGGMSTGSTKAKAALNAAKFVRAISNKNGFTAAAAEGAAVAASPSAKNSGGGGGSIHLMSTPSPQSNSKPSPKSVNSWMAAASAVQSSSASSPAPTAAGRGGSSAYYTPSTPGTSREDVLGGGGGGEEGIAELMSPPPDEYFVNAGTHQVPLFHGLPPEELTRSSNPMAWLLSKLTAQERQKNSAAVKAMENSYNNSNNSDNEGRNRSGGGCCACWGGGGPGGYDTGTRSQHHRHSSRHSSSSAYSSSSSSRSYSSNTAASSGSLNGGAKLNLSDGASAMVSIVDPRLRQFCNDSVSVDPDVNVMQDTLLKILRIQCSKFDSKTGKIKPPDDPKYKAVFARFTYNKFKHTRCRTLEAAIPHNILHDALLAELNETFTEKMTE